MNTSSYHHWIWPRSSALNAEQTLCFKSSGVDHDVVHWSSQECFTSKNLLYHSMLWVFENRKVLPSLIARNRILPELAYQPPLQPLPDGVHVIGSNEFTAEWEASLHIPVTAYPINGLPPSLKLLMELTGANCFLFLRGKCEGEAIHMSETTDSIMSPEQILKFFKSIVTDEI